MIKKANWMALVSPGPLRSKAEGWFKVMDYAYSSSSEKCIDISDLIRTIRALPRDWDSGKRAVVWRAILSFWSALGSTRNLPRWDSLKLDTYATIGSGEIAGAENVVRKLCVELIKESHVGMDGVPKSPWQQDLIQCNALRKAGFLYRDGLARLLLRFNERELKQTVDKCVETGTYPLLLKAVNFAQQHRMHFDVPLSFCSPESKAILGAGVKQLLARRTRPLLPLLDDLDFLALSGLIPGQDYDEVASSVLKELAFVEAGTSQVSLGSALRLISRMPINSRSTEDISKILSDAFTTITISWRRQRLLQPSSFAQSAAAFREPMCGALATLNRVGLMDPQFESIYKEFIDIWTTAAQGTNSELALTPCSDIAKALDLLRGWRENQTVAAGRTCTALKRSVESALVKGSNELQLRALDCSNEQLRWVNGHTTSPWELFQSHKFESLLETLHAALHLYGWCALNLPTVAGNVAPVLSQSLGKVNNMAVLRIVATILQSRREDRVRVQKGLLMLSRARKLPSCFGVFFESAENEPSRTPQEELSMRSYAMRNLQGK